jgi:hypothetical protein
MNMPLNGWISWRAEDLSTTTEVDRAYEAEAAAFA